VSARIKASSSPKRFLCFVSLMYNVVFSYALERPLLLPGVRLPQVEDNWSKGVGLHSHMPEANPVPIQKLCNYSNVN
jgi:hypothetical protein